VDDIIITASNSAAIDVLLQLLHIDFAVKALGDLAFFLGVEVLYLETGLLSQHRYILDLLKRTNMLEVKLVSSPMSLSNSLLAFMGNLVDYPSLFQSTVGSLQYSSLTHPYLAFAANHLCQFMHQPTTSHWQAVKESSGTSNTQSLMVCY